MESLNNRDQQQEQKLTPTLSGSKPGEPLFEYFRRRLPPDLPEDLFDGGLSCRAFARLIVDELGGPSKARAFWIEDVHVPGDTVDPEEKSGHEYVVLLDLSPSSIAYNNRAGENLTVADVLGRGEDDTDQLLNEPWEKL